jgi:DNA-binding beta-propeller fold protein YncE
MKLLTKWTFAVAGRGVGKSAVCLSLLADRRAMAWWLQVVVCGLLWFAGTAVGATGHGFLWGVGEAPSGTGLVAPSAVAVDSASGRVFVADELAGYVDVFDASGGFLTRFGGGLVEAVGVAVNETNGNVYVADRFAEGVDVYRSDGSGGYVFLSRWWGSGVPGREFGEVAGVAVDNSGGASAGDVYVLEARTAGNGGATVDAFKPFVNPPEDEEGREGSFVRRLSGGKLEGPNGFSERPNGISVDSGSGRVLVADSAAGAVWVYGPEGEYEGKRTLTGKGSPYGTFKSNGEAGNVQGVAVDPGSGEVYVAEAQRHVVSQYAYVGEEWKWQGWIATTPAGDLGEPRGVALSPSGDVDVVDGALMMVDGFGPVVMVPHVETLKVKKAEEGLTRTSAKLLGAIDGEGEVSSYRFQFGETPGLGSETGSQPAGTGSQTVSAQIDHLEAGHVYYDRIVGENKNGPSYGAIESFGTQPAVEGLSTGPVTGLAPEDATLTGSLKRKGLATHYYFQYGATSAYGKRAPEPSGEVPPAAEEKEEKQLKTVEAAVGGLAPNTVYHYRLVAVNEYGPTAGEDKTFTTPGPPVITIEPVTEVTQTGVTVNARINPEGKETTYQFRYGQTAAYGKQTALGSAGAGSTPQTVSVVLSALNVGTSYHYELIAENSDGTTTSGDQPFTTVPSAPIHATWASEIKSGEADLHTVINPLGHDTHFYFQYGTQPCQPDPAACASIPAAPGGDLGEGMGDTPGEAPLTGLRPDTAYHYRVLASNSLGTTEGPEQEFTTQLEGNELRLPDHRAWEMVTPPDKGGAPAEALTREGGIVLASEDGNALTYVADGALGDEVEGNLAPEMQQILATRAPSGWRSRDIATPNDVAKGIAPGNAPEYQFFTPDLSVALVEPPSPGPAPPLAAGVVQPTMYLRDNGTRTYLPLVTEADTAPGTQFGRVVQFAAATPDLSHVVIRSDRALTGSGSSQGLYEWSDGELRFVSDMPGGKPAATPDLGYYGAVLDHAVSNDGSRVFWTSKEDSGTRGGHLYLRDTTRGATLKLDAAQGVTEPEKGSAEFQGASSDGSRVFFIDRQRLTADATAAPGQGTGEPDLYECQIVDVRERPVCELHDLTAVQGQGAHADVQGLVLGISEDGASVFLVAQGVLATNANGNREHAVTRKNNLYELHYDGTEWACTFIATLSKEDGPEWEGNQLADTAYLTARVSPNGRYFAFMSQAPITGYENIDSNPAAKGARDEEVFLYDSLSATLRCVSCNPSGARPAGVFDHERAGEGLGLVVDRRLVWGREEHEHWLAGNVPGWTAQSLTTAVYQSRYLSNDGRLYFNSPDSLVPAATNEKEDVYEYEPSGVGGCQSATGGCVALLSGGSSDRESAFLEATPDGSNVFFLTEARLLPQQDTDTAFDIYDARECSETSPCLAAPPERETPCGETETCRPAEPSQPISGGPGGTASFSGPGNTLTTPSAASGKHEVEARRITKQVTRAQKLKHAIKRCRKRHAHSKHNRNACEQRARKRYAKKRKTGGKSKHKARAGSSSGRGGRSA